MPEPARSRLVLIDGSGYIFRAFFALPPLTDPNGVPVGAVFGFCNMLFRLDGPGIAHRGAREIVSDATVPGSIQVPGNGQPIVLLADGQTAGGYPKIATVIGADLGRLAALRPGETLRFEPVTVAEGERCARAAEAETRALLAAIRPLVADGIDAAALYSANLVGGVVHALAPEYRPLPDDPAPNPTRPPAGPHPENER